MAPDSAACALHVEVCYSPGPGKVERHQVELPAGGTAWQAVEASGLLQRYPELRQKACIGIWGRQQAPDTVLRERDRVELYRPLKVDPKEARRLRYRGQGKRRKLA